MRTITIDEFKENVDIYLEQILTEDILVLENGRPLFTLNKIKSNSWHHFAEEWKDAEIFDVDESDPRIANMLAKLDN